MKINFVNHYFGFEKLILILKQHKPNNWDEIIQTVTSVAHSSFREFSNYRNSFPKITKTLFDALKSLRTDTSIIITRPDKGRGTVILDKDEYNNKVESILADTTKFKVILEDAFVYISRMEDKLARLLRKFLNYKLISKETYCNLFSSGTSPGILYGLPKTHKVGTPLRPILSTIGTFNYNLAKFFVPIIEPLTTNDYTLKNSYDFIKEVKNIDVSNKVMVSFDVQSLFTNIPLNETIDIIMNGLFGSLQKYMNFTKKQFKNLLDLATKDSPFIFNDKLYVQTDGVAMGSCLGPSFANAFLCYHESTWLSDCPVSFKPLYYRRYVDDTFLLFDNLEQVPLFLNYLNSKHRNIKFTYETECNNAISFLDVLVSRVNGKVSTSVYRKPTFTGLGTKYSSFIPRLFKINAIKTLLYRCYMISSNWSIFDDEVKFLTNFFQTNGFPLHIIENCISKFLNTIFVPSNTKLTEPVNTRYIKLPYYGHLSYVIRNKLSKLLHTSYPDFSFKFIFTNNYTLKSLFPYKDPISPLLISNIVYEYTCPTCKCRYIGESRRNLTLRIAEHLGVSPRTYRPLSTPSHSSIRTHSLETQHAFSKHDFKILIKAQNTSDIKLLESLFIKHTNPELNNQITSCPLNIL